MEACASGMVPIISSVDSLGQIYGGHIPVVQAPIQDHAEEFVQLTIRALTDNDFAQSVVAKARALANEYKWSILAEKLENLIRSKLNK
jgi:glycosyltransferase involved in cell wall biosynthesis